MKDGDGRERNWKPEDIIAFLDDDELDELQAAAPESFEEQTQAQVESVFGSVAELRKIPRKK